MTANLKRWFMVSLVVLFIFGLANLACKAAKEEPPAEQEEMMQADTTQVEEVAPADTTAVEPAPEQ